VKNFRWWTVIGMTAASVALSGCGGSGDDDSGDVSVRVVNATLTHEAIDLLIDSETAVSATDSDTVSEYASASDGTLTLQLNDAGGSTALTTSVRTLGKGNHYTVIAYESGGAVKTAVLSDELDLPDDSGSTSLRFYDAAIEAGPLDIYITTVTTDNACSEANLAALSSPSTSFATLTAPAAAQTQTQGAGSYTVCATAAGSKTDLRMSLPITIAADTVVNVIMTPAAGSALINGAVLVQQEDEFTAVRNPNTRVRLAAAVSGGSVVAAKAGTTSIGSGVAPSFGFYKLVKASSAVTVTVDGGSVDVTDGALVPGGDATLLVYGDASSPAAKLIVDDNSRPTNTSATKLRLINGVNGDVGDLTLTANSSPVGIDTEVGEASSYQSLVGTANATGTAISFVVELTSSEVSPLELASDTIPVSSNATYSILAVGDVAAQPLRLLVRGNQ
jgi:hypothetical protein